jgi:multiple sugar transport system substrate-binding protein
MKKFRLSLAVLLILSVVLAACGATPEPETIIQTVEVEKVVEKTIVETVEVEVEKEVTVVQTVEVEKEVTIIETVEVVKIIVADCAIDPPAEEVEITYIGWPGLVTDAVAGFLDKCDAVENVDVNVRIMDNAAAREQMALAFSSGGESPYAIVHQSNGSIQESAWDGHLMPLNAYIDKYREEYDLDDISPVHWDAATFDGEILGIPLAANTIHLMYRADLLEKYDLEPPTTYDEVVSMCQALEAEDSIDVPFTIDLSAGWAWRIAFFEALRSVGGDFFVEGTNEPAFNSPEGVYALEKMQEVVDACMGEAGLTYTYPDSLRGLGNGAVAMIHTWAGQASNVLDPEKSEYYDKIAFAPAPAVDEGGLLAGSAWNDYWAVPATYEGDVDLVVHMIMEAADKDNQMTAGNVGLVVRSSVAEAGVGSASTAAAMETVEKGIGAYPKSPAINLVNAALGNWLPFVGTGEMTPEEVLAKAEEEYIAEATAQGFIK